LAGEGQCGKPAAQRKKQTLNIMKAKILVLTAALIGAASLLVNARPIYGQIISARGCAPVATTCGRPDWQAPAHYYHHDFRRDYDHRR